MAQPTTGEWRVLGNTAIYAGDKMIAMTAVKDVPDFDERKANMELMAAAPELLDALQDLVKDYVETDFDYVGKGEALVKKANAAIAKARKTELQNKQ